MRVSVCCIIVFVGGLMKAQEPAGACDAGLASFKRRDLHRAQTLLWDCMSSGLGGSVHAVTLSQTYRELKNYDSGLTRVEAELEAHPDNVDALYLAAYLRYRRNETKESMIVVSKAYRLAPKDW